MCGRFTIVLNGDELVTNLKGAYWYDVVDDGWDLVPNYNVAPTQQIPVIANHDGKRVLETMRWGLIPSWAKDIKIGNKMINARSETITEKPSFRAAYKKRRCVILADGFYEWKREGKSKTPMRITMHDEGIFAMAGLWDSWKDKQDPDADWLTSCTIITAGPNELMEPIHNRMPVILSDEARAMWLDHTSEEVSHLTELLKPFPAASMKAYQVSDRVNNVRNQGEELIAPAATLL